MDIAIPVNRAKQEGLKIQLKVGGLSGGHSGSEIHKEHGNANILMGRLLDEIFAASPLGISQLFGGLKDNAIPRECVASIVVPKENKEVVETIREGLKRTGGYCPCRLSRTEEYKCMCKEFKEQIADPNFEGFCHCLLYYKHK